MFKTLFGKKNAVSQEEQLIAALSLKTHDFEKALKLIKNGADGGYVVKKPFSVFSGRKEYPSMKAVDLILNDTDGLSIERSSSSPERFYNEFYRFGCEKRVQLLKALHEAAVKFKRSPSELLSDHTMSLAAILGRAEAIEPLKAMGAEIKDEHLVDAAATRFGPYIRNFMLKALLIHVQHVNAYDHARDGRNAGHETLLHGDFNSFSWLDWAGLNKNAKTDDRLGYAHLVSAAWNSGLPVGSRNGPLAIADFLVKREYPIDEDSSAGTPVSAALKNGAADIAMVFLKAGAKPLPGYMAEAVDAVAAEKMSPKEAMQVMNALHERGVPFQAGALSRTFEVIAKTGTWEKMGGLAEFLAWRGAKLERSIETTALCMKVKGIALENHNIVSQMQTLGLMTAGPGPVASSL